MPFESPTLKYNMHILIFYDYKTQPYENDTLKQNCLLQKVIVNMCYKYFCNSLLSCIEHLFLPFRWLF